MPEKPTTVDEYLEAGCGRCPLGGTPECKVHRWEEELRTLRQFLLDCGLTEEVKWSVPCYTWEGSNVAIASAFKEYCSLSFFKGALLKDPEGILEQAGPNSQAARLIRFTNPQTLSKMEGTVKAYILAAIEVEKAGLKVEFKKNPEPVPEELQAALDNDSDLKAAFEGLTPGRKRSYILHISGAKQAKTRHSRTEACREKILAGKGFHDR